MWTRLGFLTAAMVSVLAASDIYGRESKPRIVSQASCNQANLIIQHQCLMANAISAHNYLLIQRLINTPYVDVNDTTVAFCRSNAYAGCAVAGNDLQALDVLFGAGMKADLRSTNDSLIVTGLLNNNNDATFAVQLFDSYYRRGLNINAYTGPLPPFPQGTLFQFFVQGCSSYPTNDPKLNQLFNSALSQPVDINVKNLYNQNNVHIIAKVAKFTGEANCQSYFTTLMARYANEMKAQLLETDQFGRFPVDYAISSPGQTAKTCVRRTSPLDFYNVLIAAGAMPTKLPVNQAVSCGWYQ